MPQNTDPAPAPTAPFTVCPRCNYPHKDAHQARAGHFGGSKGGKAKVPKGFSSPAVLAKALATRRAKAEAKAKEKAQAQNPTAPPPQ